MGFDLRCDFSGKDSADVIDLLILADNSGGLLRPAFLCAVRSRAEPEIAQHAEGAHA